MVVIWDQANCSNGQCGGGFEGKSLEAEAQLRASHQETEGLRQGLLTHWVAMGRKKKSKTIPWFLA